MMLLRASLSALLSLSAGVALVAQTSSVVVTGAWVREPIGGRGMTSAYAVVDNSGAEPVSLTGVTTDIAGAAELHEMAMKGEVMEMRRLPAITVPAGGRIELKPGGYHVMLFDLKRSLKVGDTVSLVFTTAKGTTIKASAVVGKEAPKP